MTFFAFFTELFFILPKISVTLPRPANNTHGFRIKNMRLKKNVNKLQKYRFYILDNSSKMNYILHIERKGENADG